MIIGGLLAGEIGTTRPYGFLYPAESHELTQIMAGQDARGTVQIILSFETGLFLLLLYSVR